jgi:hypothetical protein
LREKAENLPHPVFDELLVVFGVRRCSGMPTAPAFDADGLQSEFRIRGDRSGRFHDTVDALDLRTRSFRRVGNLAGRGDFEFNLTPLSRAFSILFYVRCPPFRSTLSRERRSLKTIETPTQSIRAFNQEDRHVEGSKRQ